MTTKSRKLPRLPMKDDKADRRCGLIDNRDGDHTLHKGDEDWCHGCKFYVCDGCSQNMSLFGGGHDIMDHLDGESEDDDGR